MPHLETTNLRVEHVWSLDRFQHRILVRCSDAIDSESFVWQPVLESMEGTAADAWPQSPPWQQIVDEPIGLNSESVLLGVGLSGNGHWSIAIGRKLCPTSTTVDGEPEFALHFDIACKISKSADFLGSTWRCCEGWRIESWKKDEVVIKKTASNVSIPETPLVLLQAEHGSFLKSGTTGDHQLLLQPDDAPSLVKTHRWAFIAS